MTEQNASAVPLPQERQVYPVIETPDDIYEPAYLEDEAFYPDEASTFVTARGLHHNKFAFTGVYKSARLPNPILSHELTPAELTAFQGTDWVERGYEVYVAPGTSAATPVKVTLFFAVGTELRRFGLRSLFQQPGRVLIRVPGIESGWTGKPIARAWGVGVDEPTVTALLAAAGLAGANWAIDVLAAYSTGYRGLNGTILHSAAASTLDLSQVSVVVVYDCLYRGDQPAPGHNTKRALESVDGRTAGKVRVVVYEVTPAGTPRSGSGDTSVSQVWLNQHFANRYTLINLKPQHRALQALICARFLEAASADGYLKSSAGALIDRFRNAKDEHIARLVDALPPRWTTASTNPAVVAGTTPLQIWASANKADIDKLHASSIRKSTHGTTTYGNDRDYINGDYINRFNLAGWRADMGERLHDSFIPEFGHEFLRGAP